MPLIDTLLEDLIGSYQAIKHKLADMYVKIELANQIVTMAQ